MTDPIERPPENTPSKPPGESDEARLEARIEREERTFRKPPDEHYPWFPSHTVLAQINAQTGVLFDGQVFLGGVLTEEDCDAIFRLLVAQEFSQVTERKGSISFAKELPAWQDIELVERTNRWVTDWDYQGQDPSLSRGNRT